MDRKRPRARKVVNSGSGSGVEKVGSGLGTGKVGSGGFFDSGSSTSQTGSQGTSGGRVTRSGGGLLPILAIAAVMLFGGGGLAVSNMGSSDYQDTIQSGNATYDGWYAQNSSTGNTGVLNTRVSPEARPKFTNIVGDGGDRATVMLYMCGTDLESRSSMGTSDLNEMISATIGSNVNLIVYTGGCKGWRNSLISSGRNQIWQIKNGNISCLMDNAGNDAMTKPETLSSFIKWTAEKFPANRMSLIFWDHGGGSISGYGYDEKFPRAGSMTLSGIDSALKDSGIKYDFIGFDTCLMATAETAMVVGKYADYMIGSEETEPGIGWFYTNWLTALSKDSSIPTLQLAKIISDDFVDQCSKRCPGQPTTLSVVDLSELTQTLPDKLNEFAQESADKISRGEYKEVATARAGSKEFARGTNIDQIDLIHFARLLNTSSGKKLADTLGEAIKYNTTAGGTANAYGLSIYFPYRTLSKVDSMTSTYEKIGMDGLYTDCIRKFAQMETGGQAVSGGTGSPFDTLFGGGSGSGDMTTQAMQQLINSLFSGGYGRSLGIEGLDQSNTRYLTQNPLDPGTVAEYIAENHISSKDLKWVENSEGKQVISLTEEQWEIVDSVDLNMFYDDGSGYIELGLDNIYDFDGDDNLLPDLSASWISINDQPVAYYHLETVEDGDKYTITGYVPIMHNGHKARLILAFDESDDDGYIAGISTEYSEDETQTEGKSLSGLKEGDEVVFLCDHYTYNGKYNDSYKLGKPWTVKDPDGVKITNTDLEKGRTMIVYKFVDIYGQEYWTPAIKNR